MKYFELEPVSPDSEKGWFLSADGSFEDGTPLSLKNIWDYSKCMYIDDPLPIPFVIKKDGIRTTVMKGGLISPIVSRRAGEVIQSVAPDDIQRIPAKVEGDSGEWEVINILHAVECIDYELSITQFYPPDHSRFPGKPSAFFKLVIDISKINNHHIFRIKDYMGSVIISEVLLDALRAINATGLGVTQVYPNDGIVDKSVLRYLEMKKKLKEQ